MRVRNGKATAVNIRDGPSSTAVSARARGFLQIIEKFEDKVSADGLLARSRIDLSFSYLT